MLTTTIIDITNSQLTLKINYNDNIRQDIIDISAYTNAADVLAEITNRAHSFEADITNAQQKDARISALATDLMTYVGKTNAVV